MPTNKPNQKAKQLSLEEYGKIKEKQAKSRLGLHFPLIIKVCIVVPALFCAFLIFYYLLYARLLPEH